MVPEQAHTHAQIGASPLPSTANGTAAANPFLNRLDIGHILTHRPPLLNEVLPGLHAGAVGLIVGPGGIGKTMLELQIAVGMACGESICGGLFERIDQGNVAVRQPGKVLLVLAEESVEVVWHRLHAIVSTLANTPAMRSGQCSTTELLELWSRNLDIISLAGQGPLQLMDQNLERTHAYSQLQRASEGAELVIIDPLRQLHQCDENSSAALTAFAQHMQALGRSSGASVICAHHTNRSSAYMGMGDAAAASRGSSALTDAVRWQLNISAPSREAAKQFGIAPWDINRYALLDLPKANYVAPQPTELLQRLPGGVLVKVDTTGTAGASTGPKSDISPSFGVRSPKQRVLKGMKP